MAILGWILLGFIIGAVAIGAAAIYIGSNVERDTEHTRRRAAEMLAALEAENRRLRNPQEIDGPLLATVRPQPQVELVLVLADLGREETA